MKRLAAIAVGAGAICLAVAPSAFAASYIVTGDCGHDTQLHRIGHVFTKAGTGNVDINYTNCIGAFDNNELRVGLVKANTSTQFTTTRVLTSCGKVYNLGTDVKNTTAFQIQYRSAVSLAWNTGWSGTVYF